MLGSRRVDFLPVSKAFSHTFLRAIRKVSPKKDIGMQKIKKTPFGQEVSVI